MSTLDKMMPHSLDAEQIVLGSMLMDKNSLLLSLDRLTEQSFYKAEHQKIFKAIQDLNESNIEVDYLTITQELKKRNELEMIGGAVAIMSITNNIASTVHIERHCIILIENQILRELIDFGAMIGKMSYDQKDVFDINDYINERAYKIQNIGRMKEVQNNSDLIYQLTKKIELAANVSGITGVATGFRELDGLLGGWQKGELYVIAARPSMGKTALALCSALHGVIAAEKRALIFSLEMSRIQVLMRAASLASNVPISNMARGRMSDADWQMYHNDIGKLESKNLVIIDDCFDVDSVVRRTKQERLDEGVDIIFLDYIQITSGKGQNRDAEIGYVTRKLKQLSLDLDMPVVALAQLNRNVEGRADKKPRLSDLRESGSIEQDADCVMFVHRPSYYDEGAPNEAYLLVQKNRNGALKDIELFYDHSRTKFRDTNPY